MFPNSDIATGVRRVTSMGNAWLNLGWTLNCLPRGNYAWSVQSVDAGYAGSAFAAEQTFTITDELTEEEEEVEASVDKKLLEAGWTLVETFSGVDCADNYFAFLDAGVGAKDHDGNGVLFQVLGHAVGAVGEFHQLACHALFQTGSLGNAVTYQDDNAGFADFNFIFVVFDLTTDDFCNFFGS
mgnify:CR=1 FL=1